MTAALAIAATSEVLRFIVEDAMVRAGQALNFAPPATTVGPPPRPTQQGGGGNALVEPAGVNLFLYHVTPNPAWRNMHSPERDRQGRRLNNAPLVLDLHYLLSAHGSDIDREIGFGTAMHALHQAAIVPMELVRLALKALIGNTNPLRKILAGEGLPDQIESLTVTPQTLDIDAVTKIWNAAQAPFRPSAGYLVTTVFLEDMRPASQPLPIASAAGLDIVPLSLVSIDTVSGLKNDKKAPITSGAQLEVRGRGFGSPDLSVTLDTTPLTPDGERSGQDKMVLDLPSDLTIGSHYLEVARVATAGSHLARISAAAVSITLLPLVTNASTLNVTPDAADATLLNGTAKISFAPDVLRTDTAILRLIDIATGKGHDSVWAPPTPAQHPANNFSEISIKFTKIPAGTYIVRILVGGISSQPEPAANGELGPRITL